MNKTKEFIDPTKKIPISLIKDLDKNGLYTISYPVTDYYYGAERKSHTFCVDVCDLEFIPFGDNLREVDTKCEIYKEITKTLLNDSNKLILKNEGIKIDIDSKNFKYDNINKKVTMSFDVNNSKSNRGIMNGSHTQSAIANEQDRLKSLLRNGFPIPNKVKIEVFQDLTRDQKINVAADSQCARPQQKMSANNLKGHYDVIKRSYENELWSKRVCWWQMPKGSTESIPGYTVLWLCNTIADEKLENNTISLANVYDQKYRHYENYCHLTPELADLHDFISGESYKFVNKSSGTHIFEDKNLRTRKTKITASNLPMFVDEEKNKENKKAIYGKEGNNFIFSNEKKKPGCPVLKSYFTQLLLANFRYFLDSNLNFKYSIDQLKDFCAKYLGNIILEIYEKEFYNEKNIPNTRKLWSKKPKDFFIKYAELWEKEIEKQNDTIGYVIYASEIDMYKVGISTEARFNRRQSEIKTKTYSGPISTILIIKGGGLLWEKAMLYKLTEKNGEWFNGNNKNKEIVNKIKAKYSSKNKYEENEIASFVLGL